MGKSYTPKYRVEYRDQSGWHSQCWSGRVSDKHAEDWRVAMNKSFQPGGNNAHISEAVGYVLHVSRVLIKNQRSGQTVARAVMPMFEVA